MEETVKKFIEDNKLTFEVGSRNSEATILCGFINYLNEVENDSEDMEYFSIHNLLDLLNKISNIEVTTELEEEIEKVFKYAENNDYGKWWTKRKAHSQYIF